MARTKPFNQEVAEAFLSDERYKKNLLYCRSWDTFYLYEDGWYRQMDGRIMSMTVYEFSKAKYDTLNLTTALVHDIVEHIKWIVPRQLEEINTPYIALKDKLINMKKFEFEEFNRDKVAIHRIDCQSQDVHKPIPKFKNFLRTTLVDNQGSTNDELINLVQEMFGFYLINGIPKPTVFFLVGQGANGKSVMLNVLEQMIGPEFRSAMSIQTLTTSNYATAGLIGMKINICSEEESKYLRSDKFKALASGEATTAERKYENQFTFKPQTKYIFATNLMPTFDGVNYGIRRRMMIIPFNRIFKPNEQNHQLSEELVEEIPGIINWAIEGAERLTKNNFTFSHSVLAGLSAEEFENQTSSSMMFFRDEYQADEDSFVDFQDMYNRYKEWCNETGKRPLSMTHFNRDLRDNLGVKQSIQWSSGKNKSVRGHHAKLRDDSAPAVDMTMEAITAEFEKPAEQGKIV